MDYQHDAMQNDIKHALSALYGADPEFPSWTIPFIRAVGILESLGTNVKPSTQPSEIGQV